MFELSIKAIFDEYEERSEAIERKQKKLEQLEKQHDEAVSKYEDVRAGIVAQVEQLHEELCELREAMDVLGGMK